MTKPTIFTPNTERGGNTRYKLYRHGVNLFSIGQHVKPFKATAIQDACGFTCYCGAFLTNISKRGQDQLARAEIIDNASTVIAKARQ